jgi:hypothetical protein
MKISANIGWQISTEPVVEVLPPLVSASDVLPPEPEPVVDPSVVVEPVVGPLLVPVVVADVADVDVSDPADIEVPDVPDEETVAPPELSPDALPPVCPVPSAAKPHPTSKAAAVAHPRTSNTFIKNRVRLRARSRGHRASPTIGYPARPA